MKAYWIAPGTSGTTVELRETATPEPKAGEVLVRVRATSLNRGELLGGKAGAVGGTVFAECIKSLGFEGRLAIVGTWTAP